MQNFYDLFYDDHTCVFKIHNQDNLPALPAGGISSIFFDENPSQIIIPLRDIFLPGNFTVLSSAHNRRMGEELGVSWESFWRAYLLFNFVQRNVFKYNYLRKVKYADLRNLIKKFLLISPLANHYTSEDTTLAKLVFNCNSAFNDPELRLVIKDAVDRINQLLSENNYLLYFQVTTGLYTKKELNLEKEQLQKDILTGLFRFEQSCKANNLKSLRFKVFLSTTQWHSLVFDNKSHYHRRECTI